MRLDIKYRKQKTVKKNTHKYMETKQYAFK